MLSGVGRGHFRRRECIQRAFNLPGYPAHCTLGETGATYERPDDDL
jgi:hypothetical protein